MKWIKTFDLTDQDYKRICEIVYEVAGIQLNKGKQTLVSTRLRKRLIALDLDCYYDYIKYVERDPSELSEMITAITTNYSFFFRETDHFDFLKSVVKKVQWNKMDAFKIWSAGCATGEEVYSIAITLLETDIETTKVKILGTDISQKALRIAKAGEYGAEKFEEYKEAKRIYFDKVDNDVYKIKSHIRNMVQFGSLNLMSDKWPFKGQFDIIFCRNVMIYFDYGSKVKLLKHFYDHIKPGGYLFVGHAESLADVKDSLELKYVKPAIYQKKY